MRISIRNKIKKVKKNIWLLMHNQPIPQTEDEPTISRCPICSTHPLDIEMKRCMASGYRFTKTVGYTVSCPNCGFSAKTCTTKKKAVRSWHRICYKWRNRKWDVCMQEIVSEAHIMV